MGREKLCPQDRRVRPRIALFRAKVDDGAYAGVRCSSTECQRANPDPITSGVPALFVLFVATLFFRTQVLRTDQAFVPITSAMLVMADWITATLLFAQALVLRAQPLRALAAGYFFAGLFVALRVLALPGILMPAGPFDPSYNVPYWFYLASHAMLPLAIMAHAWPSGATGPRASNWSPGHYLVGSVILAGTVIIAAAISETSLTWTSPIFLPTSFMLLFSFAAMIMLAFKVHSVLDLWLLLVLWGWFLELALPRAGIHSLTAGWYAARSLGLCSACSFYSPRLRKPASSMRRPYCSWQHRSRNACIAP